MTHIRHRVARELADQALSRAAGATLIPGNRVRLLRDAEQNYPAWMRAIESARHWVHFEAYIIYEDRLGREFAELLSDKAREGVRVRLVYDWFGSLGTASRRFWRRLEQAGVDVRSFNPFRLDSPFGWISRDHRKLITVDGRAAFVAGLCVGELWAGIPEKRIDPWRDTGVEIMGPAVADLERSFADTWASTGPVLDSRELPSGDDLKADGNISLRIVAGVPNTGGAYRVDQLFATLAQRSIWLSDAYFVGTGAYIQALQGAARSGVDVRLLIPGSNNLPVLRAISRAGLRPLLEAGVRVFEWNGSMMHAKTAVVDGQWSRVGSTNLNLTSWLGNRELDVLVEDEEFARQMEEMYLEDLSQSTEIVLSKKRRRPGPSVKPPAGQFRKKRSGGTSRTVAGVLRLGQSVGAAVTNRRELGPAEAVIMVWGAAFVAILSVAVAVLAVIWPWAVAAPLALLGLWTAVSLVVRAYQLRARKEKRRRNPP